AIPRLLRASYEFMDALAAMQLAVQWQPSCPPAPAAAASSVGLAAARGAGDGGARGGVGEAGAGGVCSAYSGWALQLVLGPIHPGLQEVLHLSCGLATAVEQDQPLPALPQAELSAAAGGWEGGSSTAITLPTPRQALAQQLKVLELARVKIKVQLRQARHRVIHMVHAAAPGSPAFDFLTRSDDFVHIYGFMFTLAKALDKLMIVARIALSIHPAHTASANGPVSYVPSAPRLMNRNFKTHLLEQQLEDKESQVRFLRYQLRMAEEAADARAMHVAEQLAAISVLQEQVAAQRKARTQAQLLLASRAADQQRCASRVADLDSDLDVCGTQLTALLGQGAAAAGPAGSHLPQPGAHRG
ncbi:hypothetical protein QJQ45_007047, partial [Haematococcus lacustris]